MKHMMLIVCLSRGPPNPVLILVTALQSFVAFNAYTNILWPKGHVTSQFLFHANACLYTWLNILQVYMLRWVIPCVCFHTTTYARL